MRIDIRYYTYLTKIHLFYSNHKYKNIYISLHIAYIEVYHFCDEYRYISLIVIIVCPFSRHYKSI